MIVRCPLDMTLGYGHAAANICDIIDKPLIYPFRTPQITDHRLTQTIHDGIRRFYDEYNANDNCLTIWHEFDLAGNFPSKGKRTALSFFEINALDNNRIFHLNCADDIIVASQWAANVLEYHNIKSKIRVEPMGVDRSLFYPTKNDNEEYKFFSIGKAEHRKGTELLLQIFQTHFKPGCGANLYLLSDSKIPKCNDLNTQLLNKYGSISNIHFIKSLPTDQDYAAFIRSMDCGVFLTKSEGFGFPIAQSIACGKPTIVTNYSAITEFANDSNAMLVKVDKFSPAIDNIWFHGLGTWAEYSANQVNQVVSYMKECLNSRPSGGTLDDRFCWGNFKA